MIRLPGSNPATATISREILSNISFYLPIHAEDDTISLAKRAAVAVFCLMVAQTKNRH